MQGISGAPSPQGGRSLPVIDNDTSLAVDRLRLDTEESDVEPSTAMTQVKKKLDDAATPTATIDYG